jgi:hypothetical protein
MFAIRKTLAVIPGLAPGVRRARRARMDLGL